MIAAEGLTFAYGKHNVLRGVSFTARAGHVTALLGPNGAGKTTLFGCMLGLNANYGGSVKLFGREANTLSAKELAKYAAYIPQSHTDVFGYTVEEMVLMGATGTLGFAATPKREQAEAAHSALERAGIAELFGRVFTRLSGGEKQMVLIARAICQASRALIMDEPTANLDFGNQARVMELCCSLAREGYAVLLSTHNPQHALWYADRAVALKDGQVLAQGESRSIITEGLIGALYGIKANMASTEYGAAVFPQIN